MHNGWTAEVVLLAISYVFAEQHLHVLDIVDRLTRLTPYYNEAVTTGPDLRYQRA